LLSRINSTLFLILASSLMRAPCTVLFFALLESFSLTAKAASRSSLLVQAATNATYNSSLALAYSRLSSAAYCDAPDLAAWDCLPCSQSGLNLTEIQTFADNKTDSRAFAAKDAVGNIYFSIRGSHTFENFIKDLEFFKADKTFGCPDCRVHSGFLATWAAIATPAVAAIKRLYAQSRAKARVTLIGHSLGAAVALLATYQLIADEGVPIHALYTYGCPRVGNAAFAEHMQRSMLGALPGGVWRHTHWRDPVPHLPLHSMGFRHVPREVWSDEHCKTHTLCDGSGEDPKCANSLDFFLSIDDHLFYYGFPIGTSVCKPKQLAELALATAAA